MKEGLLLFGQSVEAAGRGIAGPRLRTAAKKAGFDVEIIDSASHLKMDEIFDIIDYYITTSIKFVGLSTSWIPINHPHSFSWLKQEFFEKFKEKYPNLLLITGGHQHHQYNHIIKNSDYHFQGFSDLSFVEFLKHINNLPNNLEYNFLYNKVKLIESNLNFPIIDPNDIETIFTESDNFLSYQPLPIELSRGCIFRCTFCRHPFQGKKDYDSYQRTPANLAIELKRNYDLFGTTRYSILDDTVNDSLEKLERLEKAIELAKLPKFEFVGYIKPELLVTKPEMIPKLANLGLRGAYMGFESFKNETRRIIGKGTNIEKVKDAVFKLAEINKQQILIYGSLIVGLPKETPDEIYESYEFLSKNVKKFCNHWEFSPLNIINDSSLTTERSMFDKMPAKFNYSIVGKYQWSNEFFTQVEAQNYALLLNDKSAGNMYYGGWLVAGGWNLGMSEEEIQNSLCSRPKFFQKCTDQLKNRAKTEYNIFINTLHKGDENENSR